MTTWQNRIIGHGEEAPDHLVANPKNWRIHPKNQQEPLHAALETLGWLQEIIVNVRSGEEWPPEERNVQTVVDGHLRITLALRHEQPLVPIKYVDLSPSEEALALATLDPLAALAIADKEKLDGLLRELPVVDARLQEMLAGLARQEGRYRGFSGGVPDPEIDRAEELRKKWGIETGQVWEVSSKNAPGKSHRLMCGDSTKAEDVKVLLNNCIPFLMVTDPPYGVEYDPSWREEFDKGVRHSTGKVLNDDKFDWFEAWKLFPGDVAYVWHAGIFAADVALSLSKAKFVIRNQIIWRKQHFVFGRGAYHWQHEPCWYAVRNGKKSKWCGDHTQSTVWDIQNSNPMGGADREEKTVHGTEKPLECMARPIRNHGETSDSVYDPFCGSGTTMIASEQLGRACYGMEISPAYVAVSLERLLEIGLSPRLIEVVSQ